MNQPMDVSYLGLTVLKLQGPNSTKHKNSQQMINSANFNLSSIERSILVKKTIV
jgi:hypothetical protein